MTTDMIVQLVVMAVTAGAGYWLRHSQGGDAGGGAAPAPAKSPMDAALDLAALKWPVLKPIVAAIEKAEADGALKQVLGVLAAQAQGQAAPPAAPQPATPAK